MAYPKEPKVLKRHLSPEGTAESYVKRVRSSNDPLSPIVNNSTPSGHSTAPITNQTASTDSTSEWLKNLVSQLDRDALIRIIFNTLSHPKSAPVVAELLAIEEFAVQRKIEAERRIPKCFDHYSKLAWHAIHSRRCSKGSVEFELSFEACDEVEGAIQSIREEACKPEANFGTQKNALVTLRKIGKTIALSDGTVVGREVQKRFQNDTVLEDTMFEIVENMTPLERESICLHGAGESEFMRQLDELMDLTQGQCLFEGLVDVVEFLRDPSDEVDGSSEEEDEHKHEDDESRNNDHEEIAGREMVANGVHTANPPAHTPVIQLD